MSVRCAAIRRVTHLGLTCVFAIVCAALALLAIPRGAAAATITVTNTLDTGAGSLRAALIASANGDTIVFSPTLASQTIVLSSAQLTVTKPITINGAGAPGLAVSGNGAFRVFSVTAPLVLRSLAIQNGSVTGDGAGLNTTSALTLTGVTFMTNTAAGATSSGGGVFAAASLALSGTQFISNTATFGGGAYSGGPATLNGALFLNNMGNNAAGGIYANAALAMTGTQFLSNTATGSGGGAWVTGAATLNGGLFQGNRGTGASNGGGLLVQATLSITGTQFIGNAGNIGGGIYVVGATSVTNGLFRGNAAAQEGGGLNGVGTLALTNTQFLSNTASLRVGGARGVGTVTINGGVFQANRATLFESGGLYVSGIVVMTRTQFLGNTAGTLGGGMYLAGTGGRLANTLFAANAAAADGAAAVFATSSPVHVVHTTIASPTVASGSALAVNGPLVYITNTLIASYTVGITRAGGTVIEDYTLFDSVATPRGPGIAVGAHSLTGTAAFVSAPTGDYHLAAGSDARDVALYAGLNDDFEGDPRPLGTAYDIGFDEGGSPPVCFATPNNGTTVFSAPNAQALRDALAAAAPGATVKIAGICAGVVLQGGQVQVAIVTRTITMTGGYTTTNWAVSYPITQPTTIDAFQAGQVLRLVGVPGNMANLTVQRGTSTASGGGIAAPDALRLTNVRVLSNTAQTLGGGVFASGTITISGGLFQNNAAANLGGGLYTLGGLSLTGTQFLTNTTTAGDGGGAWAASVAASSNARFQGNTAGGAGGGGGLYTSAALAVTDTAFVNNAGYFGAGAYAGGNVSANNGLFRGNAALNAAGGLYASSALVMSGTQFISNTAASSAGGAWATAATAVNGGLFQGNTAGGAGSGGGLLAQGTLALTGTQFIGNAANTGGGAYVSGAANVLSGTFIGNAAGQDGAGMYAQSTLGLSGTQFLSNTAQLRGGGARVFGLLTVSGGAFQNNRAVLFDGGAVQADAGVAVTATRFIANAAGQFGGGLYQLGAGGRIVNALFARNSAASGMGLAAYVNAPAGFTLLHTTIASPTVAPGSAFALSGGTAFLTNTLIASHTVGITRTAGVVTENFTLFDTVAIPRGPGIAAGPGSIVGPATFINAPADDYHLSIAVLPSAAFASAARDTGVNAGVFTDADGDPRPIGPGFDIGFDEAPMPLCYATANGGASILASLDAQALRDALATVTPGGTVKVAGRCAGAILESGQSQVGLVTQSISILGGYTPTNWSISLPLTQPTVLDALSQGRVLSVTAVPATIANLTVQNGFTSKFGGGIAASGSMTLTNVNVLSNTTKNPGGVLDPSSGGGARIQGNLVLSGGLFSNNSVQFSDSGGGLYVFGSLVMTGTRFVGNRAAADGGGLKVIGFGSLSGGSFEKNTAGVDGGAVFGQASLTLNGTRLLGNVAGGKGGGANTEFGSLSLIGTEIISNTAGKQGGGANSQVNATLSDALLQQNSAPIGGGLSVASNMSMSATQNLSNTAAAGFGGGALVNGTATVNASLFRANAASGIGGGLYVTGSASLQDTQFIANSAGSGGGALVNGGATVNGSLFRANAASGIGGGLYVTGSVSLQDTRFIANSAGSGGGAFARYGVINGGVFSDNVAAGSGGGIQIFAPDFTTLTVNRTQFLRNTAATGGGLAAPSSNGGISVVNALFAGNTALSGLGAAARYDGTGSFVLIHTTVASPTLAAASAVLVTAGSAAITDTIVASHTVGISQTGGTVAEDYNLFFGNTTDIDGSVTSGGNGASGDPRFAAPWGDDYRLTPGSAARDTGANAGVFVDFQGDRRPIGPGFDIGYDEMWVTVYVPNARRDGAGDW